MLGGSLSQVENVNINGLEDERYLVVIEKISETPQKYPRRPGMPEKRPLK
jgi:16S rRNA (guanine527-N7)-methyltransferase